MLAGISSDYYAPAGAGPRPGTIRPGPRGAGHGPALDADAATYLIGLSQSRSRRAPRQAVEKVPPSIVRLLGQLDMPALVQGNISTSLPPTRWPARSPPILLRGSTGSARRFSTP